MRVVAREREAGNRGRDPGPGGRRLLPARADAQKMNNATAVSLKNNNFHFKKLWSAAIVVIGVNFTYYMGGVLVIELRLLMR